jgi:hypothetical protein
MKFEPHKFENPKNRFYKPVCFRCGLMKLNNKLTDWCVKQGCNHDEHPEYKQKVFEYTSPSYERK